MITSEKRKKRMRAYRKLHREAINAQQRQYQARPDVKAKRKAYRSRPDVRAKMKAYRARPDIKQRRAEAARIHQQTPEWKAYRSAYQKAHWRSYRATPQGQAAIKRMRDNFRGSPRYIANMVRSNARRDLVKHSRRALLCIQKASQLLKEMLQ